jgi:DNA-binding winged helix-turn-helix (wHTH) protein
VIRFGAFELDVERGELRRQGRPVPLQELPLRLLTQLLERPGETIRREEIRARLWPDSVVVDFEHGLNTVVRKLRLALGDSPARPRFIETVPRRGYRFVGRVLADEAEPAPPDDRADAAAALARTPFVGRTRELGQLAARLSAARSGYGSFVLVGGEPGIGKTRLLEELAEHARGEGVRVLWGRCIEGEWSLPYAPFGEALGEWARATHLQLVRELVGAHAPLLARIAPALGGRLADLAEPPPLEAEDEGPRIAQALVEILRALAEHEPLLLVVDDLQWADRATHALLRRLAPLAGGLPLLITAAGRLEPDAGEVPGGGRIELAGIDVAHLRALLETLADHAVESELPVVLHRETGGNPFFVREILLHLAEVGDIGRVSGEWRRRRDVADLDWPASVREVVERRLARLSDDARRLLLVACVFPGSFDFPIAAATAGLAELDALDALDEALEAQLVRESNVPDRYEFSHALVRGVLYAGLNPSRRTRTHRRVAEGLERERGRALSDAEIVEHWRRSADLPGAEAGVGSCLAAAEAAERVGAHVETAAMLRIALLLAPASDGRRPAIEGRLGLALAWSGARGEAARVAAQAAEGIARSEGAAAAAAYLADAADAVWWSSIDPEAWTLAEQGLRHAGERRDLVWARLLSHALSGREANDPKHPGIACDGPDRRELTRVVFAHPAALELDHHNELWRHLVFASRAEVLERAPRVAHLIGFWAGEYREALTRTREGVEAALRRHHVLRAALLLALAARFESALGELAASQASQARAEELGREATSSPLVPLWLGAVAAERAQIRGEGFEELMPGYALALAIDVPETRWVLPITRAGAAAAHALLGSEREALAALEPAREALAIAPGWSPNYVPTLHLAISTLWHLQRADRLEPLERQLRERVLAPDFRHPHADARLSLARLCALGGRHEEAAHWVAEARRVLDAQVARPLRALCDYDEACARRRAGADPAAPLARARAAFAEIGMPGWLRRAEALEADAGR